MGLQMSEDPCQLGGLRSFASTSQVTGQQPGRHCRQAVQEADSRPPHRIDVCVVPPELSDDVSGGHIPQEHLAVAAA
jgi:hypothetical protein